MRNILLALLLLSLTIGGCSKYGYVRLDYPTLPVVFLPDSIHSIAIVNRSLTNPEDKKKTTVESVLTGEVAGSDKLASDECLKGVYDRLSGWHQLSVVIPTQTKLYGTGTRETPELLDWSTVKQICETNKADALLVLEIFDSNSDILGAAVSNGIGAVLNGQTPTIAPPSQIRMNVKSFWRMYDPRTQKIIDEYTFTSYLTFNGGGQTLTIPPSDALPKTAYAAGQQYIERFLPGYYTVKRSLYKLGKGSAKRDFKAAFRYSEVADWKAAADRWTQLANTNNHINAGRACLNVAVAYEVLGQTDQAFTWAKKAYEEYGNKVARQYANNLKYRLSLE